jgi:hypothetical protein
MDYGGSSMKKMIWTVLLLTSVVFVSLGANSCLPTIFDRITQGTLKRSADTGPFNCETNTVSWPAAAAVSEVNSGTWLKNTSNSEATVKFGTPESDVALAIIENNALIQTRRPDTGHLFSQICGTVFVSKMPGAGGSVWLDQYGEVQPVGTMFRISVERETARVAMFEGSAVFIPLSDKSIDIDANNELILASGGEIIDLVPYDFTPDEIQIFEELGAEIRTLSRFMWQFLNVEPMLIDNRVKTAVCLALDEEWIGGQFLPGQDVKLVPEVEFADKDKDVALARQLLAEAAYPEGFQINIAAAPADDENIKLMVNLIKEQLAEVHIVVGSEDYFDKISDVELSKAHIIVVRKD